MSPVSRRSSWSSSPTRCRPRRSAPSRRTRTPCRLRARSRKRAAGRTACHRSRRAAERRGRAVRRLGAAGALPASPPRCGADRPDHPHRPQARRAADAPSRALGPGTAPARQDHDLSPRRAHRPRPRRARFQPGDQPALVHGHHLHPHLGRLAVPRPRPARRSSTASRRSTTASPALAARDALQPRHSRLGMRSPADFENSTLMTGGASLAAPRLAPTNQINLTSTTARPPDKPRVHRSGGGPDTR